MKPRKFWKSISFGLAVTDSTGGQPKVQKRDYLDRGSLPIIDQGQNPIAGYTDNHEMNYRGLLPVILFGDHTRVFKYVDFPFALGADGVKVLTPQSLFEPKFLHFYFQLIDIPNRGYSRHFKILKEFSVPWCPPSEQRRIVELLDQADALRKKRALADAKAERILPALFYKMFGNPATNPKGWDEAKLSDVVSDFRYGTSTKCESEPIGLPVLRIPNVLRGEIDLAELKYAELPQEEVDRLSLEKGDLLFVRTNGNPDYVGRCAAFDLNEPYLFASYLIRARLNTDRANPLFVAAYLQTPSGRQAMKPFIRTTAGQSNISVEGLKQIPVPLPPPEMQSRFEVHVRNFRHLLRRREKAREHIDCIFQTLLYHAFSGDLTAKWRDAHAKALLAEMEAQRN